MSMQMSPAASMGLEDNVYNRLLRERIIFLGTEVKDENANAICAQLLLLAAEDPKRDIHLYINSPGGSVSAGMAIYDTMQYVKPDVVTVAMGLAASSVRPPAAGLATRPGPPPQTSTLRPPQNLNLPPTL